MAALLLTFASPVLADVSDLLPVGGLLTDLDGQALDGDYDMAFGLYEAATGGTAIWSEVNQVTVDDGLFSVQLGSTTTIDFLDLIEASDLWLGITIGTDSEADRIPIGTVPYAMEAQYCHTVLGVECGEGEYLKGWDEETGNPICESAGKWLAPGDSSNCRLVLVGSSLEVRGADGNDLSASNACVVRITDSSVATFASPISITFGTMSDTDLNSFGTTSSVAWGNEMPMFLHVCEGSATDYFGFSRNPARRSTGSAASAMCQGGDEDCDSQGDLLVMTSGLTLANEIDRPCITVGSFRATKNAGDAWTVAALVAGQDGFGVFQEGMRFIFPAGQNGANAGYHWSGTNAPTWATSSLIDYEYWHIGRASGMVHVQMITANAGSCSDGSGMELISLRLPLYMLFPNSAGTWLPIGTRNNVDAVENGVLMGYINSTPETTIRLYRDDLTPIYPSEFTVDSDLSVSFSYRAF